MVDKSVDMVDRGRERLGERGDGRRLGGINILVK